MVTVPGCMFRILNSAMSPDRPAQVKTTHLDSVQEAVR